MLKRLLLVLLLGLSFSNNASALTLRDLLETLLPQSHRPTAPASFTATAASATTADLSWKAGGTDVGGYILLTFHDVSSKSLRLPKSCRFYLGADRDVKSHDDDDEGEDEDRRKFPRVDSTSLGMVSSYRVTGLKPLEMLMFRLCAVSASRPKRVSNGAEAFLTMPSATSIQIAAIADVLTNIPKQVSAAITSNSSYTTQWSQTAGPGRLTFSPSTGLTTKISADLDGLYQVTVTATTTSGVKASTSFRFTWATAKPVVTLAPKFFTNKPLVIPATVTSTLALTYQWTATPAAGLTFSDAKALSPTITAAANGTFVLRIVATDQAGNQGSASTNLTWSTTPPVVSTPGAIYTRLSSVQLTATAIGLGPLSYQWQSVGGSSLLTFINGNSLTPTVFIPIDGVYTARLIVTDLAGNVSTADVKVAKDATSPVVLAGDDVLASAPISLQGSAIDASAITVLWTKISGPGTVTFSAATSLTTTVTASVAGSYELQLTATDSFGNSGSDRVTYTFDNIPPSAIITSRLDSPTTTSPIPLDITFSEPVSGFSKAGLAVTGASVGDVSGSGASYQVSLVPFAATVTAQVKASTVPDQAGNNNLASAIFSIAYNNPNGNGGGSGDGGGGISTTVVFDEAAFQNCLRSNVPSAPALGTPAGGSLVSFYDKIKFLLPDQSGLTTLLDPASTGMIRGRVLNFDGTPVIGAVVSLPDYPGFGATTTSACGDFYLAANGGMGYAVVVRKPGFIEGQRMVDVPKGQFVWMDDLIMRPLDVKKTVLTIGGSDSGVSVAQSSVMTDADGPRRVSLLVPNSTFVTIKNADGSVAQSGLSSITLSASEFTVGPNGPLAMPARLPPTSKYTYATAFKIDEANDDQTVEFSRTIYAYVDNFLKFPVGTLVPSGYFDLHDHLWKGSTDGVVVQIIDIRAGQAVIGLSANNQPASASQLDLLEFTPAELTTLASTFTVGQQFWRVPIPHFTTWDFNWPGTAPFSAPFLPDSRNRGEPRHDAGRDPVCNQCSHSTINVPTHTLNEVLAVAGTPFKLSYQSDRMPGYRKANELSIPIGSLHSIAADGTDPAVLSVDVQVDVEGSRYKATIDHSPREQETYQFIWNGLDQFGRKVIGGSTAEVTITQHVDSASYLSSLIEFTSSSAARTASSFTSSVAPSLGSSWGEVAGSDSGISREAASTTNVLRWNGLIGANTLLDPSRFKMGGWWFSPQHVKDIEHNIIYFGDGTLRRGYASNLVMTKLIGDESYYSNYQLPVDYKYPLTVGGLTGSRLAVGPDDSMYLFLRGNSSSPVLAKVTPSGQQSIIAGIGTGESGTDDVDPKTISIGSCIHDQYIDVSSDGAVYFTECIFVRIDEEWTMLRRIDPLTGLIKTVAGRKPSPGESTSQTTLQDGDGGPATSALIRGPVKGINVDKSGNYFIATTSTIRKVSTSGTISTIAGLGTADILGNPYSVDDSGNDGPALQATICIRWALHRPATVPCT